MSHKTRKTTLYTAEALPDRVKEAWHRLRSSNPALYSPYFHLDYTLTIAELRDDVQIAVLEDADEIVAILPFQGVKFARPVGAPMTDYHGLICGPNYTYSLLDVLQDTPVGAYHFSALVDALEKDVNEIQRGAVMAFPEGQETWRQAQNSSFTRHQKDTRRRIRRASQEVGEPRFVPHSKSKEEFETLIAWKIQQYAESSYYNILGAGWTLQLLEKLWSKPPSSDLSVHMHSLYFGDTLVAVDTGLVDANTYHSWIVAYSSDYGKYSPGTQLLNHIITASDEFGYKRIDLGTGLAGYKKYYATENVRTSAGFVAVSGPAARLSKIYDATERFGQKRLSDAPGKLRRRYSQIAACEDTVGGRAKAMLSAIASKTR